MPREGYCPDGSSPTRPHRLQFTLKSLLALTFLSALLFTCLRIHFPRRATLNGILSVSVTAERTIVFDEKKGPLATQLPAIQDAIEKANRSGHSPHVAIAAESGGLYADVQRMVALAQTAGAQQIELRSLERPVAP